MDRGDNVAAKLACSLAGETVRTFGKVRLRVFGTSMVPSILPGDLISVQRAGISEILSGEIVLYSREGRLFAHRVVSRAGSSEQPLLITRGDRLRYNDVPVSSNELLGRLTSIRRDGMERRDRQLGFVAQSSESNYPLARLLQTSDRATYAYLRLAALWGQFARRAFSSREGTV
jgi:signal peptidase I